MKPLQLTLDRTVKLGADESDVARLALTMTLQGDRGVMDVDLDAVKVALAQAIGVVQWAVLPGSVARSRHPKDSILCQRGDGSLVRVIGPYSFDDLADRGLKYLTDAYDVRGALLPTFWLLPVVDPANPPPCGDRSPCGLFGCDKDQGHGDVGHANKNARRAW